MSELDKSSQQKKKRAPRGGTGVGDHLFTHSLLPESCDIHRGPGAQLCQLRGALLSCLKRPSFFWRCTAFH